MNKHLLVTLYFFLLMLSSTSCLPDDLVKAQEFFTLPLSKQHYTFRTLPLEKQYELYIYSMTDRHPPDVSFAYDMAINGRKIVPFLSSKFDNEEREAVQYSIILVFDMMVRHLRINLKENDQLIKKIRTISSSMKNPFFREQSEASLRLITTARE